LDCTRGSAADPAGSHRWSAFSTMCAPMSGCGSAVASKSRDTGSPLIPATRPVTHRRTSARRR